MEKTTAVVETAVTEPAASTDLRSAEDTDVPAAPLLAPHVWTLTAAARREFDSDVAAPETHAPAQVTTTSEIVYTEEPTFLDRFVVGNLRVIRAISNLIGVDLYGRIAA